MKIAVIRGEIRLPSEVLMWKLFQVWRNFHVISMSFSCHFHDMFDLIAFEFNWNRFTSVMRVSDFQCQNSVIFVSVLCHFCVSFMTCCI